jgi:hypothetical protein
MSKFFLFLLFSLWDLHLNLSRNLGGFNTYVFKHWTRKFETLKPLTNNTWKWNWFNILKRVIGDCNDFVYSGHTFVVILTTMTWMVWFFLEDGTLIGEFFLYNICLSLWSLLHLSIWHTCFNTNEKWRLILFYVVH